MENTTENTTGAGAIAAHDFYVSIYRAEQLYGGPEEGGWYYTRNFLEESVGFSSEAEAEDYLDRIAEPDAASRVADSGEDHFAILESVKGENDDSHKPRPHYE
jgi:hypothetical protein